MSTRAWLSILVIGLLAVGVVACSKTGGDGPDGTISEGAPSAADEGTVAEGDAPGASDGGATEPQPLTLPARPTVLGTRRNVPVGEAASTVSFTLLEPGDLPEDTHRDIVHLEEPPEGKSVPGLPAVRFIYTTVPHGAIIIYQSPATGDEAEGEPTDIAGHSGWILEAEGGKNIIIEWEQDGVRIQLRGSDVDKEVLLAAARSMQPVSVEE